MMPDANSLKRAGRLAQAAVVLMLSGCAFGPLPSSDGLDMASASSAQPLPQTQIATASIDDSEFHSTTCSGLQIERSERLKRLAELEKQQQADLEGPPLTLSQAVYRMSGEPEKGTKTYNALAAEKAKLASEDEAAAKIGCAAPNVVKTK